MAISIAKKDKPEKGFRTTRLDEKAEWASFLEIVEQRKLEMQSILPGFQSTVTWGSRSATVYSKSVFRPF